MITTAEMRKLEAYSVQQGVSTLQLMQNAGEQLALEIKHRWPDKKILFLCYHGNNGGDGFVAARQLDADVWFLGDKEKLTNEAKENFYGITIVETPDIAAYDVLVDALLGTGAQGGLREPLKGIVPLWNAATAAKVAVDIPTGIDPDTGEHNEYLHPDLVVTFHDMKPGLETFKEHTVVVDIGICTP